MTQQRAREVTGFYRKLGAARGRGNRGVFIVLTEETARVGDYRAQLFMSDFYGWKPKRSAMWQRRAARQGSYLGQYLTGYNYFVGFGVPKDHRSAFYWMRRSAHQGYPPARVVLSLYYRHGVGTARDLGYADRWLQAARYAMPRHYHDRPGAAAYRIAKTHLCGYGAPADPAIGRRFLAEAARAGHPLAGKALSMRFTTPASRKRNCAALAAAERKR